MRHLLIAMTIVFSGIYSMASGNIGLDARFDDVGYTPNTAAGKPSFNAFQISRLRLDFAGALATSSFRSRFNALAFNNSQANGTGQNLRDKAPSALDFAYVNHTLNENMSVSIGKIITGMGGIEGAYNPGDLYLRTTAGDELAAIYWPTGVQFEYKNSALGRLRLDASNVTEDVTDKVVGTTPSGSLAQTSSLVGGVYTGSFADGMVQPNLSYHSQQFTTGAGGSIGKSNSYAGGGAKFQFSSFDIEADYLKDSFAFNPQAAGNLLSTQTMLGLFRYKFSAQTAAYLRYETTTQATAVDASTSVNSTITGSTVAVEYRPETEENWRVHLAYTEKNTAPNTGDTKKEQWVFAGVRILTDFVKL